MGLSGVGRCSRYAYPQPEPGSGPGRRTCMQKRFAYPQPVRGPRRVAPGAWSQPQEDGGRDKTGGPILNQHLVPGAWSQVRDLNLEKMEMGTRTGYIKLALHPILCLSQLHSCTDDSKARPSLIICRVAGVRSLPYAALTGLRTQSPPPPQRASVSPSSNGRHRLPEVDAHVRAYLRRSSSVGIRCTQPLPSSLPGRRRRT